MQQQQQTSESKRTMRMLQMVRLGVHVTCVCPRYCNGERQQEEAWSEKKKHPKRKQVQTAEAKSAEGVMTTQVKSSRRHVWHRMCEQLLHALLLSDAVAVVPAESSLMRRCCSPLDSLQSDHEKVFVHVFLDYLGHLCTLRPLLAAVET